MIMKPGKINRLASAFWGNEEGATAIEYALIASAVGLTLVVFLTSFGPNLEAMFNTIGSTLGSI